jgi:hypothetical protein
MLSLRIAFAPMKLKEKPSPGTFQVIRDHQRYITCSYHSVAQKTALSCELNESFFSSSVVDFTLEEIKTLRARQRFSFRDKSFNGKTRFSLSSRCVRTWSSFSVNVFLVGGALNDGSLCR